MVDHANKSITTPVAPSLPQVDEVYPEQRRPGGGELDW